MTFDREQITEIDLMAYADGRLDPVRRRAVEAHLANDPEAKALVMAFVEQNESLRRSLAPIAAEPVPDRLAAALEGPPPRSWRSALQAASVVGLAVLSGLGGWWLGTHAVTVAANPPTFLDNLEPRPTSTVLGSLEPLTRSTAGTTAETVRVPESGVVETAAPWFTDRVTVELRAPALGDHFASPEMQRLVEIDGKPTVRFELAGPDGRAFALYLQIRQNTERPDIHLVDGHAGSTAYWQDGPLSWALTGEAAGAELEAFAEHIGTAIELEPRLGTIDAEHTDLRPLPGIPALTFAGG